MIFRRGRRVREFSMGRNTCLLDNNYLIDTFKKISEAMCNDFVEYGLEACTNCQRRKEDEVCKDLHRNLISLYNTLSLINRQVDELKESQ